MRFTYLKIGLHKVCQFDIVFDFVVRKFSCQNSLWSSMAIKQKTELWKRVFVVLEFLL